MVLTANIQYALEGYGIGENSLHAEVLAQTSSGGGSGGCSTGGLANKCCPYWNVTVEITYPFPSISCTTGGQFKCEDCTPGGGSSGG